VRGTLQRFRTGWMLLAVLLSALVASPSWGQQGCADPRPRCDVQPPAYLLPGEGRPPSLDGPSRPIDSSIPAPTSEAGPSPLALAFASEPLSLFYSDAAYVDQAIPGDQLRLRLDAGYNFRRPTRGEFFYAQTAPGGPGLPQPEPRIDAQDLSVYLEMVANTRLSGFVEAPYRFLNPEVNANANGFSDLNFGLKYAFIYRPDLVTTFQLRTYAPTGDPHRGLGTNHFSIEPAILVFKPLTEKVGFEGEFRYWVALGGTDFAGDLVRYGLSLHYDLWRGHNVQLVPVVELIGWTFLSGKESAVLPSGQVLVRGAAGDTILDLKVGAHLKIGDSTDLFGGYGRALTGDRMYDNLLRIDLRFLF